MEPHRAERVTETLREELSEIIEYELSDPRLEGVSVSAVHCQPDMRHAHILILVAPEDTEGKKAIAALTHAAEYIRRELTSRLRLFRIPELHFAIDTSGGNADRVDELLRRVEKNRKKDQN